MRSWRKAWTVCVLLTVVGLAVASATALFRSEAWIADLIESFRPHLFAAALVALPLGFTLRARSRAAAITLLVACFVVNGATIMHTARAATAPVDSRGGTRLTVVTVNLLWSNRQHQAVRDWLLAV